MDKKSEIEDLTKNVLDHLCFISDLVEYRSKELGVIQLNGVGTLINEAYQKSAEVFVRILENMEET